MSIQREKVIQAIEIVKEENIDIWLTIGRETVMNSDPVIQLISKTDFGGLTAAMICKNGDNFMLANHLDSEGYRMTNVFDKVIQYENFVESLYKVLDDINPEVIAVNYSKDVAADGLTYGMYIQLSEWLNEYGYKGKLISSERIIGKLRGCKTKTEIEYIKESTKYAEKILLDCVDFIREGVSEKEILDFCHERTEYYGLELSWEPEQCPGVMVGPDTVLGHAAPSDTLKVKKGDVVNLDFGVKYKNYCSDIQRVFYVPNDEDTNLPHEIITTFEGVQEAVQAGVYKMTVGETIYIPDKTARKSLRKNGLPDFKFGFGHQVGLATHDGGISMSPRNKNYQGAQDNFFLENMVYTADVGVKTSRGHVNQEDMILITSNGPVFISKKQKLPYWCK
ncbi:aminopeptidase P family protein [Mycoplasmatota bacterium]|nr:aminopeptidase P family protein [Mycoplasmatota bacterium]